MPDVKHETPAALHAVSSGSVYRRGAEGGYTSGTTDVDTTLVPASRMRAMSATASSGRKSPVAVYETQSAPSEMSSSASVVADTPTGASPASSPASRPALSGLWTSTPISSSSGCWRMPRSASWPTFPVLHCATRYVMRPHLTRWPGHTARQAAARDSGRSGRVGGEAPDRLIGLRLAQRTQPMVEPFHQEVDRFTHGRRRHPGTDDQVAVEEQRSFGGGPPVRGGFQRRGEPGSGSTHRTWRYSAQVADPVERVDAVDWRDGSIDDLCQRDALGGHTHLPRSALSRSVKT